ncbi:hypothetical protein ACFLUP_02275 [Chloroflexota bacterium]
MPYILLLIASLLIIGIGVIIFARPLAIWEYNFDVRWKMDIDKETGRFFVPFFPRF